MFKLTISEKIDAIVSIFCKIAIFVSALIIMYSFLPKPWCFIVPFVAILLSRFFIKPTTAAWINFRIVCGSPTFDDMLIILTDTHLVNDTVAEKRKEIINADTIPDANFTNSDKVDAIIHIVSPFALFTIPVICFSWFGILPAIISFIIIFLLIKNLFAPSLRVLGSYIRIFGAPTPDIYLMTFAFPEKVNTIVLSRQRQTHSF